MYDEAVRRLQTRITLMGQDNISDEIGLLGYIYGRLGQRDKAKHQLDQLDKLAAEGEYVSPRARVWVYLGLGEVGTAVELLRMGLANHTFGPLFLRFYPREFVRNDSLFIELQKGMGLLAG
jgi:hypothetical protein